MVVWILVLKYIWRGNGLKDSLGEIVEVFLATMAVVFMQSIKYSKGVRPDASPM
jgi:hypothetical protein